jgi:predicted esterase
MGESCALALDKHPKSTVLHVNGGFHSEYWDGTARQFMLRRPNADARTVAIVPTSNPAVADIGGKPVADFVVFVESRASDVNDGTYSVSARRSIEYRLHLPAKRDADARLPLLIWFADDGESATDSLALLRKLFGKESAIAVIEAPYRETQDDLVEGGRWFWPNTFSSDIGTLASAAEEVWAFALRHQPIDPTRVCFAGEGTGATVASAVALLSDRASARTVAFSPRKFAKLKDIPLPLPELRGDLPAPEKSLQVYVDAADESWWRGELAEYTGVGLEGELDVSTEDPWLLERERESALRSALGLEPSRLAADAPRRHIVADGVRARSWARLIAADRMDTDGALVAVLDAQPTDVESALIETEIVPEKLASGTGVPRCPGPFGGTTVIVLHESASPDEIAAWVALEDADPLAKKSPFLRLRIATSSGERSLANVLTKLASQGRKNVLIVPATFCADGETMRALRRGVQGFEDQMTLQWRPGLGGSPE